MSDSLIKPQTLRGFRDFLPEKMIPRLELIQIARTVYAQYGFSPIDTPALEYTEILLGKGEKKPTSRCFASLIRETAMSLCVSI